MTNKRKYLTEDEKNIRRLVREGMLDNLTAIYLELFKSGSKKERNEKINSFDNLRLAMAHLDDLIYDSSNKFEKVYPEILGLVGVAFILAKYWKELMTEDEGK